jgi:hypothetical protein
MFGEPIEIASRDPMNGDGIRTRVAPDGAAEWSPAEAVVVAGVLERESDSCYGCCPVLNFFASRANAERWLAEHWEARGDVISDAGGGLRGTRGVRRRAHAELMPIRPSARLREIVERMKRRP